MKKKWEIKNRLRAKNKKLKADEIVRILLKSRGLKTKKQINQFLNPPDPYTLKAISLGIKKRELTKAIKRIKKAITLKEAIIIYGDYDADGICSTAIMWETLHALGAKVMPFIPHREKHGYGLNKKGIEEIIKTYQPTNPPTLIITVDNGIVAHEGVKYADKKGLDVIISDHHQSSEKLPSALAIIHSDKVSGTGVAWFLAKEIYGAYHQTLKGFKASNSLELASIGTVTDMMPMLSVNRSLVKFGLEELKKSKRQGILSLCNQSGVSQKEIGTYHIGYIIGPRLNAMGRLGNALESLRLLCTKKTERADNLAFKLNSINRQRQELTRATLDHAKARAKRKGDKKGKKSPIIFVSHKSYNQGIVGLVAGRLVDEFYRPAVVISREKEFSRGSVRSIKGFNVIKNLRKLKNIFEDLGGHPMAAGFTIKTGKIKEFEKKLEKLAKKEIKDKLLQPRINIDLELDLSDINWKLFNEIEKFSPFGLGNVQPLFVSKRVEVVNVRAVGRERKHLKLKVQQSSHGKSKPLIFDGIAFNMGDYASKLSPRDLIDICFSIEKNVWNGKESLELKINDLRID